MLDRYHYGHYRVYNLCAERGYDETRFTGGSVITFPMDDHHVPPLPMLFDFIRCAPPLQPLQLPRQRGPSLQLTAEHS